MSEFVSVWAGADDAAHVAVTASGQSAQAVAAHVPGLVADGIASKIAAKDPTLWGKDAIPESSIRLGWVSLHETARSILPELQALVERFRAEGKTRVVLCGMGGSSLGPEVIAKTHGVPLIVLDSTDPGQVRAALSGNLATTVVVVSSKSGGTVETDSQRRTFEEAFRTVGLDPAEHFVIVTDPGSPLEAASIEAGYRNIFLADPNVGGRFSVLSAFGLVPAALAGADVEAILDEAAVVAPSLAEDSEANPALVLGAAMVVEEHPAMIFRDFGSGILGLGDWAEQLIAESTGKNGVGLLPVVVSGKEAPDLESAGTLDVRLVPLEGEPGDADITVAGTLGAHFLLWEYATAIASRLLGIGPFDQPDVESAKVAARRVLDAPPVPEPPGFVDGGIEVRGTPGLLDGAATVESAVASLEATMGPQGYLAVMAYLDREEYASLEEVRSPLARRTGRPVTFGWGPRFLHSTGQLHKGGQPVGVFLQITSTFSEDIPIPGRPFTFGTLIAAQAAGDAAVLSDKTHGRPVLRLNLTTASEVERIRAILGA